jgi:hypothetical protein
MSLVEARERRERLRNPPNAVRDYGIDLKRRGIPKVAEDPKPTPAPARFVLPYDIGGLQPVYTLRYDVPYQRPEGALSVRMIQRAVCQKYNITLAEMLSAHRTANVVLPRQIAMYLAKLLTGKSLPDLGRRFGGKDHTTILHGVRKITALRLSDAVIDAVVIELSNLLVASPTQTEDAPCSSPQTTAP